MTSRTVHDIHPAMRDDIGDLLTRRPLPGPKLPHLDPFLFLNHHGPQTYPPGNGGLPFGPHPHRGFETVTFILAGQLAHRDSAGHESTIDAGGVQWMTAGRGLVHSELSPQSFLQQGGELEILQLWINLPAKLKMTEPKYTGLQRERIPRVELSRECSLDAVCGDWFGTRGAITPLTDMHLATLALGAAEEVRFSISAGRTVFLYVVRGELSVGGRAAPQFNLVQVNDDGDELRLTAIADSVVLLGHAAPFGEPIVAHGPFVMNTREEIIQAMRDYQSGVLA